MSELPPEVPLIARRRTAAVIFCLVLFITGIIVGYDVRCSGATSPKEPVWKNFSLGDTAAADTNAVHGAH